MSANVSVITNNTKEAISSVVDAYNGNVLKHINGDLGAHNQVRVHAVSFAEPVTGHIVSDHTLRIQVFNPQTNQTVVLAIPCFVEGSSVSGGPPVILIEPVALISAFIGTQQQFTVQVASQSTPAYQWQKLISSGFASLPGQTSNILVFPNVQNSNAGAYQVVVSNAFGSVVSTVGSLTASIAPSGGGTGTGTSGDGCLLPGTLISLPNGSAKKVEDVVVGDSLLALNNETNPVEKLIPGTYHTYFIINARLRLTYEHPILVKRGAAPELIESRYVSLGDNMVRGDGSLEKVISKKQVNETTRTHNFVVGGNHLYIADGIVVHNPVASQKT